MTADDSILDRIIQSKEIDDIEQFRPQESVETLLKYLSNREKDVLRRRFGLSGTKQETLEKIGNSYKVTRERIRQIETLAVKKLKKINQFEQLVAPIRDTITTVLKKNGGIMRQEFLLGELLKLSGDSEEKRNCVLFLLEKILQKQFVHVKETKELEEAWKLQSTPELLVQEAIESLITIFEKETKPLKLEKVSEIFSQTDFYKHHEYQVSGDAIASYLDLSKKISKNPFDEYGLMTWGNISPKRMNDKIYLVLKKEGEPMHFNEITEKINMLKFDERPAYPPTVHNELILNSEYVLVGRGMYALREWGYKPGVVSDVIRDILQKENTPLTKEDLVTRVLKKRIVKKNTIHLALTDKKKFRKLSDGTYTLAESSTENQ